MTLNSNYWFSSINADKIMALFKSDPDPAFCRVLDPVNTQNSYLHICTVWPLSSDYGSLLLGHTVCITFYLNWNTKINFMNNLLF